MKPYYEHAGITIYHGDCREILPQLPKGWCSTCACELADEQIVAIHLVSGHQVGPYCDLVLTDPPYGIDRANGMGGKGVDGFGKNIQRQPRQYDGDWDVKPEAEVLHSAIEAGEHAIVWGGNYFADVLPLGKKWLVWDKEQTMPSYSDAELAWTNLPGIALKMFRLCGAGLMAVEQDRWHPTQKPLALMKWCLRQSADSSRIIDPFAGSGSSLVAAKELSKSAIGIEIEEKYCEIAAKRLSQEVFQF